MEHCDSDATTEISNKRAAPWINSTLWEDAVLARELGVRLIYRNSHYNVRYGVNCADDQACDANNLILMTNKLFHISEAYIYIQIGII